MSNAAFIVRLRPLGPWRFGAPGGARDRVETVLHSDTLFSALTSAMHQLGYRDEWLATTPVAVSSLFPFRGNLLYVVPPRHLWPPASSPKVRWKAARFVPMPVIGSLLKETTLNEDRWAVDPVSEALVPIERNVPVPGPFRIAVRSSAAVDRLVHGSLDPQATACLEFTANAGLWCVVSFSSDEAQGIWPDRVKAAFRLLADEGIGGRRSAGWGHSEQPEFQDGTLPELLLGPSEPAEEPAHWLLSLFSPSPEDAVDWSRGNYCLITRGGHVVNSEAEKLHSRMIEEGSVLFAASPLKGALTNVAPPDFPHPVYRSGAALSIPIPWRVQP